MQILFIHQNFPGQFKFLAPALAGQGHKVVALTLQDVKPSTWQGVQIVPYRVGRGSTPGIHPWVTDLETKAIRAEACFGACLHLKAQGFTPDVIVAHPGWGESLFVKRVWPDAKLGIYCEFFYLPDGADTGFDPEFSSQEPTEGCRLTFKNINNVLHFESADAGIAPTHWQASTFPAGFRERITVIHDGIDTTHITPLKGASLACDSDRQKGLAFTAEEEIVTFVNRNLEPYRGYHVFMRALPDLLRRRPNAKILLVGGEGVSYGAQPPKNKTWKRIFVDEVIDQIDPKDWSRVHFLGNLPYAQFVALLRVSSLHVYLTYPFVLSWSLLEAMSAGCAILASDTAPLKEVIIPGQTGELIGFFDYAGLAKTAAVLLEDKAHRQKLGAQARELAVQRYDLTSVCLPRQLAWVHALR